MTTKILQEIASGTMTRKGLETLRANAERKGGHQDIVDACTAQLAKTPATSSKKGPDHIPAEVRRGFTIMLSGMSKSGSVARPDLIPLAEVISSLSGVQDVAVLKTQIRFYYQGHHMVSGRTGKRGYWMGVLDETKLKDGTVEKWKELGDIATGAYFSTRYVNVSVKELEDLGGVLAAVQFIH